MSAVGRIGKGSPKSHAQNERRAAIYRQANADYTGPPYTYECPTHGRFVARSYNPANGDPPAEAKCMTPVDGSYSGQLDCGEWSPRVETP